MFFTIVNVQHNTNSLQPTCAEDASVCLWGLCGCKVCCKVTARKASKLLHMSNILVICHPQ